MTDRGDTLLNLIKRIKQEWDPKLRQRLREQLAALIRTIVGQYAAKLFGQEHPDVEDVAQDVFLSAEAALLADEVVENPEGFLYRCTRNAFITRMRQNKRAQKKEDTLTVANKHGDYSPAQEPRGPEQAMQDQDLRSCMQQAFKRLTPEQQNILAEVVLKERSPEEIVDELMALPGNEHTERGKIRNSKVDAPLYRARIRFKQLFEQIRNERMN